MRETNMGALAVNCKTILSFEQMSFPGEPIVALTMELNSVL